MHLINDISTKRFIPNCPDFHFGVIWRLDVLILLDHCFYLWQAVAISQIRTLYLEIFIWFEFWLCRLLHSCCLYHTAFGIVTYGVKCWYISITGHITESSKYPYKNIAIHKPTWQTSTILDGRAEHASDRSRNPFFCSGKLYPHSNRRLSHMGRGFRLSISNIHGECDQQKRCVW